MPDSATKDCPQREAVAKLAGEELPDDRGRIVQRHLEQCEPCRAVFRKLTAERFPRLRSYTVIARIGAGAFGEVFKVIHHVKQRTEALKLLYTETRFRTASFENEVHAIARLRHPNIATLFDAKLGTPPLYYTMELVEGRQLDEHFRSPDVSLAERIEIFRQVALAMDYAHRQGVVHRDLKPQNILIDTAGQPRIVDFGIARKLALAEDEGAVAAEPARIGDGTYAYIAPEEKAGQAADGRADVYALGVLLHQAVTGTTEVSDERPGDPIEVLRQRKISRAADLSAIIVRCLQEDPARRYSTCAKLAEDLAAYSALRPVAARVEPSAGYRTTRAARLAIRRHAVAILVVLVAVAACGLAGLLRAVGVRRLVAGFGGGTTTTVIQFRPSTIEAIRAARIGGDLPGLSAGIPKSWRLLHGELMRVLAEAGPRVVVWDYFVPDCYPEYDQGLLRGFDALKAAGIPVVIGASSFDVNGKPRGCREILAAAHSIGALHGVHPQSIDREFVVPICIRYGLSPPVPSLPLAGFAAARFPDSILDLRPEDRRVLVCYRRRQFEPGQPEWRAEIDVLDVAHVGRDELSRLLHPGAEIFYARVNKSATADRDGRIIGLEDVLTASPAQLRSRFGGRVVLIGPALPGTDEYATADGKTIFGHHVQARALDSFLAQARLARIPFFGLLLRALLWSVTAAWAAHFIPVGNGVSMRRLAPLCLASCGVGLIGVECTAFLFSPWVVEAAIGACCVLVTGSLVYLVRACR